MSRPIDAIRARSPIWWAVLAVAACGVVATAHGLYKVARACDVTAPIAGVYPVIADGLALVAYASVERLRRAVDRAYAWFVVVLAAGLSATAQGIVGAGIESPSRDVRFWVHFAPAVAVLLAMHLRWLVARPDGKRPAEEVRPTAAELDEELDELVATQVGAGLDRLRAELLDALSAKLDDATASKPPTKPVSKSLSKSVSKSAARSEDYREAVRRMLADGVSRSTASYRADAAEKAGTIAVLLEQYPAVRPVETTATA